jgi:hypothetical protein
MTDCFSAVKNLGIYNSLTTNIDLNEMNMPIKSLSGTAKKMALLSKNEVYNEVDGGKDDIMNKIIWYYSKGDKPYPNMK